MQRLVTALLLLAASPASGGALEEPWLGVYRDPDGLTIFMRQVVTKEPGMISARSADWVIRGSVDVVSARAHWSPPGEMFCRLLTTS